ncbi:hypothetical protein [Mesorhizobium sp.]|uniref:hypothetical protein n=1 Tax=Mesorhizobium sp. TaxID=1871066 RepID=UPI000FE3F5A8|nr:hypothetical protein [Mesorhizobium sp.]RWG78555.1 MAG: hypothetical protein EOQ70_30555 [Mesorhizobium sp.]RWK22551.1 MAG: hypothetical protein EOR41_00145 [Mesorhizobium sp.]
MGAVSIEFPAQIKRVAKQISDAADSAILAYREELITDEPSITDRWLGAVANASAPARWSKSTRDRIYWRAKTLRSASGRSAEEKRHGADLLGVAEIHVGGSVIRKGFLGQAKRIEPGAKVDGAEWARLKQQSELMLERSAASFILTYSRYFGIMFVPAITVANIERADLFTLNRMTIRGFFEMHLGCFIGDRRLSSPNIRTLDALLEIEALRDFPVENILHIIVTAEPR